MGRAIAVVSLALLALTALDAEAQKKGGTLRVGILGEPPSLDVHWTTATITETLGNHIYEGLYTLDATNRPIPMLAESHTVSKDNLVYTFDSADAQEESLASVHPFNSFVGDKRLQQWLVPTTLSSQPIGRDVKTYAKPPFTLTALDYTLIADGDNAKLEMTETIVPRSAGQQALRFGLTSQLFVDEGKPSVRGDALAAAELARGAAAAARHLVAINQA